MPEDAEKRISKLILVCRLAIAPDHAKFCEFAAGPRAAKLRDARKAEIARRRA